MPGQGWRKRDDAAHKWIDGWVTQSQRLRDPLEDQWEENWMNARVEPVYRAGGNDRWKRDPYSDTSASSINSLKTPESHQILNTLRGLLLTSLFGVRDYVQAVPVGHEDVEAALKVSRLVMFGIENDGNYRCIWDTLTDALAFGIGDYTSYWKNETRIVPRRVPVIINGQPVRDPKTGHSMTVLQNVEDTIHDDVRLDHESLWNVWFDPGARRLADSDGIVKYFRMSKDSLRGMREEQTWDKDGLDRVLSQEPTVKVRGPQGTRTPPKLLTEQLTEDDLEPIAGFGYYGGFRYDGMLPSDVADDLGLEPRASATLRVINGVVVQASQNTQRNGGLHDGTFTILPSGESIYGLSPLTVTKYLQDVSDTQLILTVQALIEAVYQNYLLGGESGASPNFKRILETRRPREVLQVSGDITQIAPLPKDYAGVSVAIQALNLISQAMRDASMARDPVQGIAQQSGDTTATEVSTVATAALSNANQLAILIERDELPRMGMLVNDEYYINLSDEGKVFQRIGEREPSAVSFFDIDAVKDIRFIGARSALNKATTGRQMVEFMQLLLSNPRTAASLDVFKMVRRLADEAFEVKGLEDMIITDQNEVLANMEAANTKFAVRGDMRPEPTEAGAVQ